MPPALLPERVLYATPDTVIKPNLDYANQNTEPIGYNIQNQGL